MICRLALALALLLPACGSEPAAPPPAEPRVEPAPAAVATEAPSAPAFEPLVPPVIEPPPPPVLLSDTPSVLVLPTRVEVRLPEGFARDEASFARVLTGWEHRGTFDGADAALRVTLLPAGPSAAVGELVGSLTLVPSVPPVERDGVWTGGSLHFRQDGVELTLELRCATAASCARGTELLRAIAGTFRMDGRLTTPRLGDDDRWRIASIAPGVRLSLPGHDGETALASIDGDGTTLVIVREGVEILVSSFDGRCERNRLPGRGTATVELGGSSHELERMDEGLIAWSLCEDLGPVRWSMDVTFDGEDPAALERELLAEASDWELVVEGAEPTAVEGAAAIDPSPEAAPGPEVTATGEATTDEVPAGAPGAPSAVEATPD